MNLLQALSQLNELKPPLGQVLDHVPASAPRGSYAVVSDISDVATDTRMEYQDRQTTVLVTIYGPEGGALGNLRPLWRDVRELGSVITSHPGLPAIGSCMLGATLPPTFDPDTKRPLAGVRYLITYRSIKT